MRLTLLPLSALWATSSSALMVAVVPVWLMQEAAASA